MRLPIITAFALLIISAFAQASLYQITEVNPRYANPNSGGFLLVTLENVDINPGTMVRATIQSKNSGITFPGTGSYDYIGFVDGLDKRTASFPYRISNIQDGNYPLYLTVYDVPNVKGESPTRTDLKFNFTISRTAVSFDTVCGDGICESTENNTACPQDCAGGVGNATNETVNVTSYALAGSTCDIFRIDSISLKDEEDGRIDPTDTVNLGIYLHSTTTATIYDTKAVIQEDNSNIIAPNTETSYPTFGDRATIVQYFPIETKDVTPGGYGMVLKTTYVKDGRECMQLTPLNITVNGGYSFYIDLMPDSLETQPQTQITLKAHIRNIGTRDDTYELLFRGASEWVQQADRTIVVKAGQEKDAYIKLYVPPVTGLYQFTVEAQSKMLSQISSRDTTLITVSEPVKPLHAINLLVTDPRSTDLVRGEGGTFKIKVQNAGTLKETVSLSTAGASWAYLKPDTLSLQPGEMAELSLYLAPTADAETGTYTIQIKASTPGGEATADESVAVYVADKRITKTLPETAEAEGRNATALTGLVLFAKGAATTGGAAFTLGILIIIGLILAFIPKKEKAEGLVPLKGK